jgi:hypothetical protein
VRSRASGGGAEVAACMKHHRARELGGMGG